MANPATIPLAAAVTEDVFLARYDRGYELVDGLVVETPMPGNEHGEICNVFAFYLTQYVRPRQCGRVITNDGLVRISAKPLTLLGPDIAYFSYDRLPRSERPKGAAPVVPELAVEARSPSDAPGEVLEKVGRYLLAGVTAVAVIDADTKTVAVYRAGMTQDIFAEADELTLTDILPGFGVVVSELFE